MKKSTAILVGVGAAVTAAAVAAAVIYELKMIKKLTIDLDDLPEEDDDLALDEVEIEELAEAAE